MDEGLVSINAHQEYDGTTDLTLCICSLNGVRYAHFAPKSPAGDNFMDRYPYHTAGLPCLHSVHATIISPHKKEIGSQLHGQGRGHFLSRKYNHRHVL